MGHYQRIFQSGMLMLAIAFSAFAHSSEEEVPLNDTQQVLWGTFYQLNMASTSYYLLVHDAEIRENSEHKAAMDEYLASVQAASAAGFDDAQRDAFESMKQVAKQLASSADYFMDYGYTYPVEEEELEENYLALREKMQQLADSLPENKKMIMDTYLAMDHALHNYLAYHASIGGDLVNPVIGRFDIGELIGVADKKITALQQANAEDYELARMKNKWAFLQAGTEQWQSLAVMSLLRRYYPEFNRLLIRKFGIDESVI